MPATFLLLSFSSPYIMNSSHSCNDHGKLVELLSRFDEDVILRFRDEVVSKSMYFREEYSL